MSGALDKRLARVALAYRRPVPPLPDDFDPRRLDPREQVELDDLLRLIGPDDGRGRSDFGALDDDRLDRMGDLSKKACGIPPGLPHFGMDHRDPGIGPCLCVGCAPRPRPNGSDIERSERG